jgi:lipoprotein-anchoring transpeptidase ErfK/SrfK
VDRFRRAAAAVVLAALAGCAARQPERVPQPVDVPRPAAVPPVAPSAPPAIRRGDFVYLVLRVAERRLYVIGGAGEPADVESFPVAVGRPQWPTPIGRFRVTYKLEDPEWVQFDWNDPSRTIRTIPPGPDNPLGRRWIGFTSAYGWDIGFHGTPRPELLGQAVSHGCVRMRNADVMKIYDRVAVGTVVIVER